MFFFRRNKNKKSIVFHVWVAAPSWCQWHGYWHFWLRKYDGSSLFLPIFLVGASLNTWTKAWSYFLPHSFSATATGGICFGARNVLSQNENGLDLPCLKLEIARGKVAEKLHKKVLSLKWRPSPQTCTSGCQGWCAASARSCQAWWCAPCGWHCQSGLGAPASGSWKWMLYDQVTGC